MHAHVYMYVYIYMHVTDMCSYTDIYIQTFLHTLQYKTIQPNHKALKRNVIQRLRW
jgi:hypothetical protein